MNKQYWEIDKETLAELSEHIEAIKKIVFKYQLPAIVNVQTKNAGNSYRMAGFTYSACVDGDRCASDFWFVMSASAVMNIARRLEDEKDIESVKRMVMTTQAAMDLIMQQYNGILNNIMKESKEDDENE